MEKFTDVWYRIDADELCEKFELDKKKVNLIELNTNDDGELPEVNIYLDGTSRKI